ncbi:MAG: hypothetical protein KTR32_13095, partial [Granulosicoccus sp.]|nr:hypothetical protein [Granulosicoccus sp.]
NESIDCPTEDLNGNRVLDTVGGLDEDTNNNGSLDPQDPASLAAVEGESATLSGGMLVTDNNGSGFFELLYPSSNALWADVEIIARAEALGSEAEDTFKIGLPALAADILDTDVSPPSVVSPYGHQDLNNTLLKNVVLDGLTLPVLTGCETSY